MTKIEYGRLALVHWPSPHLAHQYEQLTRWPRDEIFDLLSLMNRSHWLVHFKPRMN